MDAVFIAAIFVFPFAKEGQRT